MGPDILSAVQSLVVAVKIKYVPYCVPIGSMVGNFSGTKYDNSATEHEVLKASSCDRSVSVVRLAASTLCFK